MDLNSSDLIYAITLTEIDCDMQYVGQTGKSLKTRFREHFCKMNKPKKIDICFFIAISKITGIHLVKL